MREVAEFIEIQVVFLGQYLKAVEHCMGWIPRCRWKLAHVNRSV
jgi:hypothetical protein